VIANILRLISIITRFFKPSQKYDRLKEDKQLADAIKSGDSETVSKIRERRKHYSKLGLILFLTLFCGCITHKDPYKDVPLTAGSVAYQLPAGGYTDTAGVLHNEQYPRWSLSEEDLFNNTREIDKKVPFWKYGAFFPIVGTIIILFLLLIVKRKN